MLQNAGQICDIMQLSHEAKDLERREPPSLDETVATSKAAQHSSCWGALPLHLCISLSRSSISGGLQLCELVVASTFVRMAF